jgi:long-chain acyl-CoA synthetase
VREFTTPVKVEIPSDARLTDKVFERATEAPNATMFRRQVDGRWRDVTARQFRDEVVELAKGLMAAGIEAGDRVALMSRTRYEWTLADYAIWTAGAVTVTIYDSSSPDQIEWILSNSGSKALIVEGPEHAERAAQVTPKIDAVQHTWQIDGGGLTDLAASGSEIGDEAVEERRTSRNADDLATIIYTSGTTGNPKGCELSHKNILHVLRNAHAEQLKQLYTRENRRTLLFLPIAHSFGRIVQVGCVENDTPMGHFPTVGPELIDALGEFKPTFILGVPRVFERVYNKAEQNAIAGGKEKIFKKAADTAIAYSKSLDEGGPNLTLRLKHKLFSKLVYKKILDRIGGECEYAISGGSALGSRLGHFFRGIGLTVLEGYGLTETSAPSTANSPENCKIGTVGTPLPGVSIKIAEDGEVLIKGDHIMRGYWDNEKATGEAFDSEGWYLSGDIGELDEDGFLKITDRKKEIIVTAGGKNVAPAVLEDKLRAHALISQCMVVGDDRKFISALITLDPEAVEFWKQQHNKSGDLEELLEDPDLNKTVQEAVDQANKSVSQAESVRKFTILPVDFTVEEGHLTPSMKIKRRVITSQFAEEIEKLYA